MTARHLCIGNRDNVLIICINIDRAVHYEKLNRLHIYRTLINNKNNISYRHIAFKSHNRNTSSDKIYQANHQIM